MPRQSISPPLESTFDRVYQTIAQQPNACTPELETTRGVRFFAEAKQATDGRRFVSLPHSNRIYEDDWGFTANSMGKDGQRIGQYSVPLDRWVRSLPAKVKTGL
jgi:hypothetical protein